VLKKNRQRNGKCKKNLLSDSKKPVDILWKTRTMVAMQIYEGRVCQPPHGGNITIIVARFNKTITQRLLDGALAKLRQHNVHDDDIRVAWVPGAYELPFIADHFAKDPDCMAIICLGAVIKGDTTHDQHINRFVSMTLGELAHQYSTPIIFGVITCDTIEQANARSGMEDSGKDKTVNPAPGNKGAEAAEAALEMIDLLDELPSYNLPSPMEMLSHLMENNAEPDDDGVDFFPPPRRVKKVAPKNKKGKGK
jgi:6,7-dimethyl-8-ribityllumazine synthase